MRRRLVIGTRRSKLAMTQTGFIIEKLRAAYPDLDCRMRFIGSPGDRDRRTPLSSFGGIGAFIRTIQQALLEKTIDVAVHSFKDLPTAPVPGLVFGAIPKREVPFDALCGAKLEELPPGAAIGPARCAEGRSCCAPGRISASFRFVAMWYRD